MKKLLFAAALMLSGSLVSFGQNAPHNKQATPTVHQQNTPVKAAATVQTPKHEATAEAKPVVKNEKMKSNRKHEASMKKIEKTEAKAPASVK